MEPLLTVTSVLSCVCAPFENAAQKLTSLRVQRKSVLQLAVWAGCSYHLGQKVLRIFHFLTHRMPIPWIWYCYGPFPHPTLVKVV